MSNECTYSSLGCTHYRFVSAVAANARGFLLAAGDQVEEKVKICSSVRGLLWKNSTIPEPYIKDVTVYC